MARVCKPVAGIHVMFISHWTNAFNNKLMRTKTKQKVNHNWFVSIIRFNIVKLEPTVALEQIRIDIKLEFASKLIKQILIGCFGAT